ncbi:MAG: hypothetical protein ACREVA_07060 [Burkholderiales bacterium]
MTIVCINRPNRSVARVFTVQDLTRISRRVVGSGVPVTEVLAAVFVGLGLTFFACRAAKAISAVRIISDILVNLLVSLAVIETIERLIALLRGSRLAKVALIRRVVALLLLLLIAFIKIQEGLRDIQEGTEDVATVRSILIAICSKL